MRRERGRDDPPTERNSTVGLSPEIVALVDEVRGRIPIKASRSAVAEYLIRKGHEAELATTTTTEQGKG